MNAGSLPPRRVGRRINVRGVSGSGKSTFAKRLAGILDYKYVEFDAINWQPGMVPLPDEEFRNRVRHAISGEDWVADGNYGSVRDIVMGRIDTLVWLDYGYRTVAPRIIGRTFRRIFRRELLWGHSREGFKTFFCRENIILWSLTRVRKYQKMVGETFASMPAESIRIKFSAPAEAEAWLQALEAEMKRT